MNTLSMCVSSRTCRPSARMLLAALLSLALVGLLSSAGSAATISYSFNFGPDPIPLSPGLIGTLPQFDSSLGTLNQVDLNLSATTDSGEITWDNEAGVPSSITLGIGAEVTITGQFSGLAATAVPLQTGFAGAIAADSDGAPDFLGSDSFSVIGGSGSDSDTDSITGLAVSPYIGVGTFDVTGQSTLQTSVVTNGGFGPTDTTAGDTFGTVTVTYHYTPVPEPETVAMLSFGMLFGMFVLRPAMRRKIKLPR